MPALTGPDMPPEQLAFLAAACAEPWDDTPRLVLADWFDENGQPDRAEFIRTSCELGALELDIENGRGVKGRGVNRVNSLRKKCRQLLQRNDNEEAWLAELPPRDAWEDGRVTYAWSRGFVSHLVCVHVDWWNHAPTLHWRRGQWVDCPCLEYAPHEPQGPCPKCHDRFFIERPCPATAMPITDVIFFDPPWERTPSGYRDFAAAEWLEAKDDPDTRKNHRWLGVRFHSAD
jgi:uncharacterized protein (TIGR02996 family)